MLATATGQAGRCAAPDAQRWNSDFTLEEPLVRNVVTNTDHLTQDAQKRLDMPMNAGTNNFFEKLSVMTIQIGQEKKCGM